MYLLILQIPRRILIYCMRLRGKFDEEGARWEARCSPEFVKFRRNAKNPRPRTTIYILVRALSCHPFSSPPPFFASHFRIDFYQKYIYLYICVYVCFTPVPLATSLTFGPRRRSPAQRSSLTYGYSNDQGTLDGSDMETLGRRCLP